MTLFPQFFLGRNRLFQLRHLAAAGLQVLGPQRINGSLQRRGNRRLFLQFARQPHPIGLEAIDFRPPQTATLVGIEQWNRIPLVAKPPALFEQFLTLRLGLFHRLQCIALSSSRKHFGVDRRQRIKFASHLDRLVERRRIIQNQFAKNLVDAVELFQPRGAVEQCESVLTDVEELSHPSQILVLRFDHHQTRCFATHLHQRTSLAVVKRLQPVRQGLNARGIPGGKKPTPPQIRIAVAVAIEPQQSAQADHRMIDRHVAQTRGICIRGIGTRVICIPDCVVGRRDSGQRRTGPGHLVASVRTVAAHHPTDIGHQISIAFVAAG